MASMREAVGLSSQDGVFRRSADYVVGESFVRRLKLFYRIDQAIGGIPEDGGITRLKHMVYNFKPTVAKWGQTGERVLVVPPSFDENMLTWLDKAREQAQAGVNSIVMVPAQLSKHWFLEKALLSVKQTFIAGLVPFQNGDQLQVVLLHYDGKTKDRPEVNMEVRDLKLDLIAPSACEKIREMS